MPKEAGLQEEADLQEEVGLQEAGLQEEAGLWVGTGQGRLPQGGARVNMCISKPLLPASWEGHSWVIKGTGGLSGPQTHGFGPETVRDDSFPR